MGKPLNKPASTLVAGKKAGWKEVSIEELAKSFGANITEVREKQRLVELIVQTR
jgi:hypothetical protein